MILIKKRLSLNKDRIATSSDHHWQKGTYLKTASGTFVYVHKIVIYDKIKNKEICEFPFFKDSEDRVDELTIGYESNAEALIMGSTKKYTLKKRRAKKFDGEIFYVGKRRYNLYLPADLFEFISERKTTKLCPTTKTFKKEYSFKLLGYPEHLFTGDLILSTILLDKNKEFIDDFFKAFNFKNKPTWSLSPATLFDVLDEKVKKDIISNLKLFIKKYDEFKIET